LPSAGFLTQYLAQEVILQREIPTPQRQAYGLRVYGQAAANGAGVIGPADARGIRI
jgi:hypothetical protein